MGISDFERLDKLEMELNLKNMMAEEGCKRKQTARDRFINEGDENTRYFHLIAKGRKIRVKILSLIHEDVTVVDDNDINKVATAFYKELFGPSASSNINMTNLHMNELNNEDRALLTAPFDVNEIKKVVFELKHNSAPGPHGLPTKFCQDFWELICLDLWNLFKDFYDGNLDIERLNYGIVTLLPKVDNAVEIKNFRPICLLNVCYKIITKVLNNILAFCITKVISDY
jgi:hypothetical protein